MVLGQIGAGGRGNKKSVDSGFKPVTVGDLLSFLSAMPLLC